MIFSKVFLNLSLGKADSDNSPVPRLMYELFSDRRLISLIISRLLINLLEDIKLEYGDIEGSPELRELITSLYETKDIDRVTVTHGGISANTLGLMSLVEPDDNVVVVVPAYQQLYSVPESIGAEVRYVFLKWEDNFRFDIDEIDRLTDNNTKVICINSPNNPTGAMIKPEEIKALIEIGRKNDAYILCDEVYANTILPGNNKNVSISDLYEKGISTGSLSKSFSAPGLRLGWSVGPKDYIDNLNKLRDYHLISVGPVVDKLATMLLRKKDQILDRNNTLAQTNIEILDKWVENEPLASYIKPEGGTTTFIRLDINMSTEIFCENIHKNQGVLLVPGYCFGMDEFIRLGYCNQTDILINGLECMSKELDNYR